MGIKAAKQKIHKSPKKKLIDMRADHISIIEEMVGSQIGKSNRVVDMGISDRKGRAVHEIRIDGIPYWIMMAG